MGIIAYITSESRSCALDKEFNILEYMFDIGFTIVEDEERILNNGVSLSIKEAPDGAIIGVDPYGRIIGKIPSTVSIDSNIKLALDYNGVLFEANIELESLLKDDVGAGFDFTKIQDEGGEGGGGGGAETPAT